jgi:hypothetical protein
MDVKKNPRPIPQTLKDLIREEIEKDRRINGLTNNEHNDYEVWPEEQVDADHKRNPYSRV